MDGTGRGRTAARGFLTGAGVLTALALAGWLLSAATGAEFPRRPVWDLGDAGPWVASYARAVAGGSWAAARACLVLAGALSLVALVSRTLGARRGGPSS
ncbi:hypothetical protein ACGFS9_26030 [Streptomyces sp. NPDC048566]|uniref:hypothetical protein n=1 Tax=Streptomyces sp. NPDC048566 TaxID=3365569 RepID=UPI0037152C90